MFHIIFFFLFSFLYFVRSIFRLMHTVTVIFNWYTTPRVDCSLTGIRMFSQWVLFRFETLQHWLEGIINKNFCQLTLISIRTSRWPIRKFTTDISFLLDASILKDSCKSTCLLLYYILNFILFFISCTFVIGVEDICMFSEKVLAIL